MSYKKRKIMIVVAVAFGFCVIGLWAWHESRPTYRVPSLDTPLHMRLAQGALRFVGLGPSRRSFVSRTHSDMRSLEAALGSYRMDTGKYPAERPFAEIVPAPEFLAEHNADKLSTIQSGGMGVEGLTTPIPYMDRIPADIFMDPLPYGYFYYPATKINSAGYLLLSAGPDQAYEVGRGDYSPGEPPSPRLIEKKYDPTNGARSAGDMWQTDKRE